MRVLITGATGFVGTALVKRLIEDGFLISGVIRSTSIDKFKLDINTILIEELTPDLDWGDALCGVDVVVHLAARVHILNDKSRDALADYRYVNVDCSLNLARQAAKVGVKRFIFLSSIKVNGEVTALGRPFFAEDKPMPQDYYGISKYEAEMALKLISDDSEMELVIIRPPLVYGPGVKANFLSMMQWLSRRIPLPFGGLASNRRSYVFLDNLVDMITICIHHPSAGGQTFLVSDDEDLSTARLMESMSLALGYHPKLINIPEKLVAFIAILFGKSSISQRLCGSLQVDIGKTKALLNWSPPIRVDDGLRKTAIFFIESQR